MSSMRVDQYTECSAHSAHSNATVFCALLRCCPFVYIHGAFSLPNLAVRFKPWLVDPIPNNCFTSHCETHGRRERRRFLERMRLPPGIWSVSWTDLFHMSHSLRYHSKPFYWPVQRIAARSFLWLMRCWFCCQRLATGANIIVSFIFENCGHASG